VLWEAEIIIGQGKADLLYFKIFTMRRIDLIRKVSARIGIPLRDVSIVVDALFEEMKNALMNKEKIEIRGFGSFRVVKRKPRRARIIKTGQEIIVPQRFTIKFKPSKNLSIKGG
jgi:nucleoid DNA-binding protein